MRRHQSDELLTLPPTNEVQQWTFGKELSTKNIEFFRPLVKGHSVLNFEYSVLCTQLAHDFFRKNRQDDEIQEQLTVALMMAELLEYLYKHYLKVPREVNRLQKEQKIYRELLTEKGFTFEDVIQQNNQPDIFSQGIRTQTAAANWVRLVAIRSKRVLSALVPLATQFQQYCRFMAGLDKVANPFFAYLAWLFFIPRLLTNLFLLVKHVIPGPWMEEKEKELGLLTRLNGQLHRRWFELANDSVWLIAGVLNCFVWLGPLAPVGIYINIALYVYDVALASLRAFIEIRRIKNLQEEYKKQANHLIRHEGSAAEIEENARFQKHLEERIAFEQKRLMISVINTTALTVAIIICLPTLAFHPVIPLVGACLLIGITLCAYIATKLVESQRPSTSLTKLSECKHSFFQPPKPKPSDGIEFDEEDTREDRQTKNFSPEPR